MKTYKATIKKVHPLKLSRNGNGFIRLDFTLEDGRFAKTDVCPNYRNYARWKPVIARGVGTAVGLLQIKKEGKLVEINADSFPTILATPIPRPEQPKPEVSQGTLL